MSTPGVACAEAISFLHLLHPIPTRPSANASYVSQNVNEGAYALPFATERTLTSTLAFLSSVKDDPNRISAVCIHENPLTGMLNVVIAVNQARYGDGSSTLQSIKHGFENVFRALSKAEESSRAEEETFSAIVSMCTERILSRMRFVPHKRDQARQPIQKLLQQAANLVGRDFQEFRDRARDVIGFINLWAKHQTGQRLCDIVNAVLQLSCIRHLPEVLGSISNKSMGPSERKALLKMIRRIGRYREAARFLYRLAKKQQIAREMTVTLVSLPKAAFPEPVVGYAPDLPSLFKRIQMTTSQCNMDRMLYILSNGVAATEVFAEQCTKNMAGGKIHAEMQLVYYCETVKPMPAPRVLASSKMACFLCNAFICSVTKFHTARCHGRLYPGWKLPVFPLSAGIEHRFTKKLESYIKTSVETLLSRQKKTAYPQPSESTLWTLNRSATTINMDSGDHQAAMSTAALLQSDVEVSQAKTTEEICELDPGMYHVVESTFDTDNRGRKADSTPTAENKVLLPGKIMPDTIDKATLRQGKTISATVLAGSTSILFEAWPLELQIEYEVGHNHKHTKQGDPRLEVCMKWLTQEDASSVKGNGQAIVIDAESLDDILPISAGDINNLYISTRGEILKLVLAK